MFERASSVSPIRPTTRPTRTLADSLLLHPVAAPGPDAVWSLSPRPVLMAVRGGGWVEVPVLAWAWNPAGGPVLWRCAVDLGAGQVGWFAYDVRKVGRVDDAVSG
ncbi:hypothetical protein ACEZCY_35680 [Streptacidiphilus sp. N1-12]|uniref:Uncharacterized protein n=1 Tax=Streptacidiphilus alkalitolerans TaxID=3342712 RepID=A0ABV6WRC5_9ACTN